jgi:hypothetical protein
MEWDKPVSLDMIPEIDEAIEKQIFILNIDELPILGASINIYDSLTYKSDYNSNGQIWLLCSPAVDGEPSGH